MGGHLASTGAGIVLRAGGLEESVERCDAEHEAESAVAIVGVEPVHTGRRRRPAAAVTAS